MMRREDFELFLTKLDEPATTVYREMRDAGWAVESLNGPARMDSWGAVLAWRQVRAVFLVDRGQPEDVFLGDDDDRPAHGFVGTRYSVLWERWARRTGRLTADEPRPSVDYGDWPAVAAWLADGGAAEDLTD